MIATPTGTSCGLHLLTRFLARSVVKRPPNKMLMHLTSPGALLCRVASEKDFSRKSPIGNVFLNSPGQAATHCIYSASVWTHLPRQRQGASRCITSRAHCTGAAEILLVDLRHLCRSFLKPKTLSLLASLSSVIQSGDYTPNDHSACLYEMAFSRGIRAATSQLTTQTEYLSVFAAVGD